MNSCHLQDLHVLLWLSSSSRRCPTEGETRSRRLEERMKTALYFLSLYCSCYMPRTHLRIMKLLQNHVQILHMLRYSLILGHRTFFIYKSTLTRTERRANYQTIIIIIYWYFNSCEEFIRLNLQRCNTHESPQEGHLGPLTFLHFSLV